MVAFFRLIRLPNLLIVALTQYLLYFQIIIPDLKQNKIPPTLDFQHFSLLVLVTTLITAGGYIINDMVDLRIDRINKPDKVIIGRRIAHQTAYWLYFCINLGGFFLATYLAFIADRMALLILFPAAVLGLLLYSTTLKKSPLWGNLLVSGYCAGVAAIVWIAEQSSLIQLPENELNKINHLLIFYAVFAFFSTLFREIVKDIEDTRGDSTGKARTAPIIWGEPAAKTLAGIAGLVLLLTLGYAAFVMRSTMNVWGLPFLALVGILIIISLVLLQKAHHKKEFYYISQFAKVIMLCGILLLLFFK